MGAKITKFPVTAPSGREYEVSVERVEVCLGLYGIEFKFYRYESRKSMFGRSRTKRVLIMNRTYWESDVSDVKQTVEILICKIEAKIIRQQVRELSLKAFEAWDGKITEVSAE